LKLRQAKEGKSLGKGKKVKGKIKKWTIEAESKAQPSKAPKFFREQAS
jgi:hypothetical protein